MSQYLKAVNTLFLSAKSSRSAQSPTRCKHTNGAARRVRERDDERLPQVRNESLQACADGDDSQRLHEATHVCGEQRVEARGLAVQQTRLVWR